MVVSTIVEARRIADKVVHYGAFEEALTKLKSFLSMDGSSSIVIRGDVGSGKKTLIWELEKESKFDFIVLNPHNKQDDHSSIKFIATELGIKFSPSVSIKDLIDKIGNRKGNKATKLVIVLFDFEYFCHQRQSLLYSLTNLVQHGKDVKLICLTKSCDCTEMLEKRVRSRLNASFYDLEYPYRDSLEQYIEFASMLLDSYKFSKKEKERLEELWDLEIRTILKLKEFLKRYVTWNSKNRIEVQMPEESCLDLGVKSTIETLSQLSHSQLLLMKVIVRNCHLKETQEFTLDELDEYAARVQLKNFVASSQATFEDVSRLVRIGLLKAAERNQEIGYHLTMYSRVTSAEFKAAIRSKPELQETRSDRLWKDLS